MIRPTVEERLSIHKDLPPVAASDPDLILDVDFTQGQAAVEAILETAEGFTKIGTPSGEVYDPIKGLNTNGSFGWRNLAWSPSALSARSEMYDGDGWSLYFEVERRAIGSTWKDSVTGFIDNDEGPLVDEVFTQGLNVNRMLLNASDSTGTSPTYVNLYWALVWNVAESVNYLATRLLNGTTGIPFFKDKIFGGSGSAEDDFVKVTVTADFRAQTLETYVDDVLANRSAFDIVHGDDAAGKDYWKRVYILCNTPGTQFFKGYVKRLQITRRRSKNRVPNGIKIGLLGDSITQRATGRPTPSPEDVATLDSVQHHLDNAYSDEQSDQDINNYLKFHYLPWALKLSTMMARDSIPLTFYNAGAAGRAFGTVSQIPQIYRDALIAYNPEYIICLGSVNDVSGATPATTAELETQTKLLLDEQIDGCPNLKKILFLTTFPIIGSSAMIDDPAKAALVIEHVNMQKSALQGYRDKVEVFDLFNAMGGNNANPEFALGSHPLGAAYELASSTSTTVGLDVHPGMTGMNEIAELVFPVLKNMIISRS